MAAWRPRGPAPTVARGCSDSYPRRNEWISVVKIQGSGWGNPLWGRSSWNAVSRSGFSFTRFARMPPSLLGGGMASGGLGEAAPNTIILLGMPRSLLRGGLLSMAMLPWGRRCISVLAQPVWAGPPRLLGSRILQLRFHPAWCIINRKRDY